MYNSEVTDEKLFKADNQNWNDRYQIFTVTLMKIFFTDSVLICSR